MKLHLTTAEQLNLITGYGNDFIEINRQRYENSLIVTPEHVNDSWVNKSIGLITPEDFTAVSQGSPEVVLLGTGNRHQFLHPKIYASLTLEGIPLECMSTAAACRTYNILMSEGRNVTAMLCLL